jgi:C4-dicarboxylate transporter DctM subunit
MELEIVTVSLLSLGILVLLLTFGVPLPYCFGGALMTMVFLGGATMNGTMVWGYTQLANPVLLCIPLFVFAGTLMSESGIAQSLLDFVNIFVGRIRGGLGVVAAVSCAIIGAISGSGLTGVAATGPILIPEMTSKGYPRGYATALVANSSILGLLIPPSVIMIIYGWVTDTSILACFLATLGPGLLITFLFCVVNLVMCRKFPLQLDAPKTVKETVKEGATLTSRALPA